MKVLMVKKKANEKALLIEQLEREREFYLQQEVGTDEYVKSLDRLMKLEQQLSEMKDKSDRTSIELFKVVATGVAIPMIGLVTITAAEKDITFTGALKEYTRLFIPGRRN